MEREKEIFKYKDQLNKGEITKEEYDYLIQGLDETCPAKSKTCGSQKICAYYPCNMDESKFCPMYTNKK
jgi:hypothetical protein